MVAAPPRGFVLRLVRGAVLAAAVPSDRLPLRSSALALVLALARRRAASSRA